MKTQAHASTLVCGVLQDGRRVLFLKRKDVDGTERLVLPCTTIQAAEDPVQSLARALREQAGIDGHVQEIVLQGRHNAGSRKKKRFIPVLAFRVDAKSRQAKPSPEFSGYAWLDWLEAKKLKLERKTEWILNTPKV